jgi:hypothetical protein
VAFALKLGLEVPYCDDLSCAAGHEPGLSALLVWRRITNSVGAHRVYSSGRWRRIRRRLRPASRDRSVASRPAKEKDEGHAEHRQSHPLSQPFSDALDTPESVGLAKTPKVAKQRAPGP